MTGDESEPYDPPEPEDLDGARERRVKAKLAEARRLLAEAKPYPLKGEDG